MLNAKKSAESRDRGMAPLFPLRDCDLAVQQIEVLALTQPEVTSDSVWETLEYVGIVKLDSASNVMGAAFRMAVFKKLIAPTGRIVKSARVSAHRRNVQVWKSLVYREVAA